MNFNIIRNKESEITELQNPEVRPRLIRSDKDHRLYRDNEGRYYVELSPNHSPEYQFIASQLAMFLAPVAPIIPLEGNIFVSLHAKSMPDANLTHDEVLTSLLLLRLLLGHKDAFLDPQQNAPEGEQHNITQGIFYDFDVIAGQLESQSLSELAVYTQYGTIMDYIKLADNPDGVAVALLKKTEGFLSYISSQSFQEFLVKVAEHAGLPSDDKFTEYIPELIDALQKRAQNTIGALEILGNMSS